MGIDINCFLGAIWTLRIITLILGIICICMTELFHLPGGYFYDSPGGMFEIFLLAMVIIAFIISIILLITALLIDGAAAKVVKIVDAGLHIVVGLLLLFAAGLFHINVKGYSSCSYTNPKNLEESMNSKSNHPRCKYEGRVATAVLGWFYAIVYIIFGIILCFVPKHNAANPTDEAAKPEINNPIAMEEET